MRSSTTLYYFKRFSQNKIKTIEELFNCGSIKIGNDSSESLPIIYQGNNAPFIKVVINGKEYLFLFDTGASACFISKEVAGSTVIENTIPIDDNNGTKLKAEVVLKNFVIGQSSFENIACIVGNTKRLSELGCIKIDGIIGASLIKLCNWKLDPSVQKISFSKRSFIENKNSYKYEIQFTSDYLPLIKFNYDKISFYALIDFGFSGYFEFNNDILKKSKKYRKLNCINGRGYHSLTISSVINGKVSSLVIDTLKSNNSFFANIPTIINQSKPNIGSGLLKRYIFVYNFLDKKMLFTPINYDSSSEIIFDLGFGLNDSNELVINFIWESDFTKKEGFKIGQQVVKINDKEIERLTIEELCDLRKMLKLKSEVKISVLEGQETKSLLLSKQL